MLTYGKYFYHIQHKPPDLSDIYVEVNSILNPKLSKQDNSIKTNDNLEKTSINHFNHESNLQPSVSSEFNIENQKSKSDIQKNFKSLDISEKSLSPQINEKQEDFSNAYEFIVEEEEEEQVEIESDYSDQKLVETKFSQNEDPKSDEINYSEQEQILKKDTSNSEKQENDEQINNIDQNNDDEEIEYDDNFEMNDSFNGPIIEEEEEDENELNNSLKNENVDPNNS